MKKKPVAKAAQHHVLCRVAGDPRAGDAVAARQFQRRLAHRPTAEERPQQGIEGRIVNLLIDADDTLWENNIYFERAFDEFVDFLGHSTLTPLQVREVLNEIELANARVHGYGSANFGRNLQQAYHHLVERAIAPGDLEQIMSFATRIMEQPLELIPGVRDTLEALASRHELTLFTKGNPDEQQLKIDSSGLAPYFT